MTSITQPNRRVTHRTTVNDDDITQRHCAAAFGTSKLFILRLTKYNEKFCMHKSHVNRIKSRQIKIAIPDNFKISIFRDRKMPGFNPGIDTVCNDHTVTVCSANTSGNDHTVILCSPTIKNSDLSSIFF